MNWNWRSLKNPWVAAGAALSLAVFFGLGLFAVRVVSYVGDIRAGEPNPFLVDDLTKKTSLLLRQKPLSEEARAVVESDSLNPMLGNPDAPVHLVEFVDYQCPFSQKSAPDVRALMARHPDEVLLIIRDFPIESVHADAMNAAIAAQCVFRSGGADTYWLYHDLLYQNQEQLSAENLRVYAKDVGVDLNAYDACVGERRPEAQIRASYQDGVSVGVRGTPTFFMNGIPIPGAADLATLEAMLEAIR